jgi:uncharacterized protein (TIGR02001 family)
MQNINVLKSALFAGIATVILSGGAMAADAGGYAGGPTPPAAEEDSPWDIAFGVTITSDYISRGFTNTDNGPAIQPYAELTYNILYLGYWGSNVDPGTFGGATWEHDLSVGVRPELGPVSFDIGYVWYLYNADAANNNSSEAYIMGEINPVDPLTLGAQFWYAPDDGSTYTEVNAAYDLPHDWSVSAAVGFIGNSGPDNYTTWNAGLTWNPIDPLEIDIRYHSAPASIGGENKVVVSATLSSSLRALGLIGPPPPPPPP